MFHIDSASVKEFQYVLDVFGGESLEAQDGVGPGRRANGRGEAEEGGPKKDKGRKTIKRYQLAGLSASFWVFSIYLSRPT